METRRFILAIALSFLVFVAYAHFFGPKPGQTPPVPPSAVPAPVQQAQQEKKPAVPSTARPVSVPGKIVPAVKGEDITVETDLLKAVVNTAGGVIKSWELKKYKGSEKEEVGFKALIKRIFEGEKRPEKPEQAPGNVNLVSTYEGVSSNQMVSPLAIIPLDKTLANLAYVEYTPSERNINLVGNGESRTLVLTYNGPGGIMIEKHLTFYRDKYNVDIEIATKGLDGYNLALGTDFGIYDKFNRSARARLGLVAMVDGKEITEDLDKIKGESQYAGTIDWFGNEDKYFTAAVIYGKPGILTAKTTPEPKEIGTLLDTELTVKQSPESQSYTLYAGPKIHRILKSFGKGMDRMIDYGWFTVLAKPMFWLMEQFHSFTHNYGVAIILLTIVVRALLFYPSLKSAKAMEEMKSLQPEMNALREKYKKDPQRMNQEMMKLYKEKKVNPLGGCLPMLMQFPFFIALYNVLSVSIELRQQPFIPFWIKDLSVHDPYYVLPVLMGVSMIVTMKMTSTTTDPQQAKIFMFMNIAFIFLFAWLPAGLLLYITLSNVLSIVQQLYVKKLLAAGKK